VLAANIVVYLVWTFGLGVIPSTRSLVVDYLALHPDLPGILFMPWQLLTYSFLHLGLGLGGLMHIAFNMLWLVWLGQEYEELYGSNNMAWLYGLGAVGGGLLTVALHAIFPGVPAFGGYVHGASGAVIAVIAAVATLHPHKRVALFLLGIWPLRWILIAFLTVDLLFGLGGGVSVSAHLGGALAGFLFAKSQTDFSFRRRPGPRPVRIEPKSAGFLAKLDAWIGSRSRKSSTASSNRVSDATIVAEIEENEVDRILDKITEHGYKSLTEKEKRLLLEASRE